MIGVGMPALIGGDAVCNRAISLAMLVLLLFLRKECSTTAAVYYWLKNVDWNFKLNQRKSERLSRWIPHQSISHHRRWWRSIKLALSFACVGHTEVGWALLDARDCGSGSERGSGSAGERWVVQRGSRLVCDHRSPRVPPQRERGNTHTRTRRREAGEERRPAMDDL